VRECPGALPLRGELLERDEHLGDALGAAALTAANPKRHIGRFP
jgi:hypothetical protein